MVYDYIITCGVPVCLCLILLGILYSCNLTTLSRKFGPADSDLKRILPLKSYLSLDIPLIIMALAIEELIVLYLTHLIPMYVMHKKQWSNLSQI